VAENYIDGRAIIAPAYRRYLFRYTSLLFAWHFLLTVLAVVLKKNFVLFPFVFMPRLGVIDAFMYLPTAFLADLGVVALVLYFVTQSGKDIRLPWPRLGADLDEVKPPKKGTLWTRIATLFGAIVMLAVTDFAIYLYVKHQTIFFVNMNFLEARPLLTPEAGRSISLIVIVMFAAGALGSFLRVFLSSRWIDIASDGLSLVLISLLLRQPFDNLLAVPVPAALLPKIRFGLTFTLLFIALMATIDLIKNLVIVVRKRLPK